MLAACVTTFCGFWLGLALGAIANRTIAPTPPWLCAVIGAVLGCVLGWRYPKQSLTVLGARALFGRNDDFR
jgi:hypothetical protein